MLGEFIVDFACAFPKLIIEVDGGQHDRQAALDARRSAYLQQQGYRVLRFWNHDVLKDREAVLKRILEALRKAPSPRPSHPDRGRGWRTGGGPNGTERTEMMAGPLSPGRGEGQGEGSPHRNIAQKTLP